MADTKTPASIKTLAFIGTVTRPVPYAAAANGPGIVVMAFDEATGALSPLAEQGGIDNPTYLVVHPERPFLYAVTEVFGWNEGLVTAYRIDPATGTLDYLNKEPTRGSITAHLSIHPGGDWLFATNYSSEATGPARERPGQAVTVFPIRGDGSLGPASDSVAHAGGGPVADRQGEPHPHCSEPSPDGAWLLVADLGIDAVVIYRFDAAAGRLTRAGQLAMPPGSGPRHLSWHPNGRTLYAIGELDQTISTLAWADGELRLLQTLSALPAGYAGPNHCADLHVAADGRTVYGSNRGHDSIAAMAIDTATGALTPLGHTPTGGHVPRSFAIDPSDHSVLAANQDSDTLVLLRRDAATGRLAANSVGAKVGTPTCVKLRRFAP